MNTRHYSFHLKEPLYLKTGRIDMREGAILEDGSRLAEIAPLPGFSSETLARALHDFKSETLQTPSAQWAHQTYTWPLEPTLITTHQLIGRLPLPETIEKVFAGCMCVKLKVSTAVKNERLRLEALSELVATIRIDSNQELQLHEAEQLVEDIDNIEYLEEPLLPKVHIPEHIAQLEELTLRTALPYALDETLVQTTPSQLAELDLSGLAALVIKPALLGYKTESWLEFAVNKGKKVVLSSCFESPVGLYRLAQQAAQFPGFHGLEPLAYVGTPLPVQRKTHELVFGDVMAWAQRLPRDS